MSRAFVKEGEDRPDEPIERPISGEPNYVTPSGLAALRASLLAAEKAEDARNVRYYRERVESAVEVDPAGQPRDRVAFGAAVRTLDERGNATQVRIVGEDEADPAHGTISWLSPHAQALLEKKVGDRAVVRLPHGERLLRIETIAY
jgi:transcription elongation GreA/GreB family factor